MPRYTIGIDFGTLSGRAVLADVDTGEELSADTCLYAHGVISDMLPDGTPLGADWALQDPQDYLDVLNHVIPSVIKKANVSGKHVVGIGIDFTSCTFLPVCADGRPLCFLDTYRSEKHAYVKLWKHHAAQSQTERINDLIIRRNEPWAVLYGGQVSSEWQLPKVLQILEEAPDIFDAADYFLEAGDWIVWYLTGQLHKSACAAGYKGLYMEPDGYPKEFFKELDPRLIEYISKKMNYPLAYLGNCAGKLRNTLSRLWDLNPQTAVSAACIDAHVILPAVCVTEPGTMVSILGTSACHILLSTKFEAIQGISGTVKNGIYFGYYAYEAGQSCFGDHFSWFLKNFISEEKKRGARQEEASLHKYFQEKAAQLRPAESGLLALDWWNGNRSVLSDDELSGLLLGLTLQTKPEEV